MEMKKRRLNFIPFVFCFCNYHARLNQPNAGFIKTEPVASLAYVTFMPLLPVEDLLSLMLEFAQGNGTGKGRKGDAL
jgi:hypothetical protein